MKYHFLFVWALTLAAMGCSGDASREASTAFKPCQGEALSLPLRLNTDWMAENLASMGCALNASEWRAAGMQQTDPYRENTTYYRLGELSGTGVIYLRDYPQESQAWLCRTDQDGRCRSVEPIYYNNAEGMLMRECTLQPDGRIAVEVMQDFGADTSYVIGGD